MERTEDLECLLENGEFAKAIQLIKNMRDYHEGELFVHKVFNSQKTTPELIDAVLNAFLKTKPNYPRNYYRGGHGGWVHSLSHFTRDLWTNGLYEWIKKFNQAAFQGANELRDTNCSDRLLCDFAKYAKIGDDPADFHITPENIRWVKWEKHTIHAKNRIENSPFASMLDYLNWRLRQTYELIRYDNDFRVEMVDSQKIRSLLKEIQELGGDVSEFANLEKNLLQQRLSELEAELPKAEKDWRKEWIEKAINKIRADLEILG